MPTTSRGYPYPDEDTDPPNGAVQIQALAQAVNDDVAGIAAQTVVPAWQPVSGFPAGANPGSGVEAPEFAVWPDGRVELRGQITATTQFATGGVTIATLPAGARPPGNATFVVAWNGSATQPPTLQVASSGALTLFCTAGVTLVSLDAVRFRTS